MARGARRGRRRGAHKEEESAERWLLTYADMITLLMALFMVLFSISSVNISKVQSLQESLRARAQDRAAPPRKRLSDFFRASFAPELLDPQLFNVWVVFWSMVAHSPEIRAVHDRTYGKYRSILEALLGELVKSGAAPRLKLRSAAIALTALLDGLWVELSLSAETFKPSEAIAICEDWIGALCAGAFPQILREKRRKKR